MAQGAFGWHDCGMDGPTHRHTTAAALAACNAEWEAHAAREASRFVGTVPPEFFRDSASDHFVVWASER